MFLAGAVGSWPRRAAGWAGRLPGVVVAQRGGRGRQEIAAAIEAEKLNRVVVAGGNGHLDGGEYEAMLRGAGLDGRLLRRVSLREQVVYPHAALTSPLPERGGELTRESAIADRHGGGLAGGR